ncbi:sigma 54-interacting transcriptional regulator [Desulfosporosinus nitroreducens]|uniref:HTH-type transcriptional regulatory protein TyrR n=1 Tax=Desulfosporosinus nitroreducens TaxID=2018668 RepID=A0ABT8QVP2_9FIRM|nr:sigma 54-interacting transcriptional regulator [Desulfosporosinus nitroreducens]MDO0825416.1 sigma 54-interacting transcriptional regulator [Desulfosporosinus nitroreducens]
MLNEANENYLIKKSINLMNAGLWEMTFEEGYSKNPGGKVMWTQAFRTLLGFSNELDFPGVLESWLSRIHSDDCDRVLQAFTSHVEDNSGETSFDEQYRMRLKNNQYRWFRTIGETVRNEQGIPLRFIGSLLDIHEQRNREQEREFLLTRFELISRALTEGPWDMEVVAGDPINPKFWWSPQFRNLLGYHDEDDFPNVLNSWINRLHPEDKEMTLNAFFGHLNDYSGNTPYSIDYRLCLKNDEYRWFHAHGFTLRDDQGVPLRVAGTIRDIEHEKQKIKDSEDKLNRYCEIINTLTKKQGLDPNLTFISSEMKELVKSIEKYAKVDAPILITGESGVGKEVVTDLIHNFSDRKEAPFLKINCGAIPEALLESELFGYEEGAFSGAKKGGKIGFFELANNGTVLLDEIGDLPLQLQVKLLRFVQSYDFYKIGGKRLIKVNTRIVAATNRDLECMVQNKQFRSDLFYRLQVLTIHIPALRDRLSDIIPLTNYFLNKFNETYHTNKTLSSEVYNIFTKYLWPGNVRELENLMERLVVTSEMDTITLEYIPQALKKFLNDTKTIGVSRSIMTYKQAKEQFERQYFQQVIEKYGSTRKAAKQIEVDHSTIVKKASKYGIDLLHWQR